MGTQSIIMKPNGIAWEGRYCHLDGYPSGVGAAILEIVQRDGLIFAQDVLFNKHKIWTTINGEQGMTNFGLGTHLYEKVEKPGVPIGDIVLNIKNKDLSQENSITVVGYGESIIDNSNPIEKYIITDSNLSGYSHCKWSYLMSNEGLQVEYYDGKGVMGIVPWSTNPLDIEDVLEVERFL